MRDILTFPAFQDATIALVDINPENLENARQAVERIIEAGRYPAKVIATTDRAKALPGADGVLSMLMAQPLEVFKNDLLICERYGVKTCVGDTRGAAGIFRFLRTVPVMLDILSDIQRYCPGAVFLNYTNPMAMLCRAMQEAAPEVTITGLCHSVQGGIHKFAQILGVPAEEITYLCAGINHMAYYLKLEHNGRDLYPELRRRTLEDKEVYESDIVRNEVFLALGYYVTESSGIFRNIRPGSAAGRPAPGILLPRHQLEHGPHQFHHRNARGAARNFPKSCANSSPNRSILRAETNTPRTFSTPCWRWHAL